ncbi:DUF447 domain-containing protein [Candidatus Laterigemmans baculatus]|uniref:DUF447 domain-containing protein n=1 Tax=Candidatus Laterigemmans baculatus TaxID=2770505 RepID=UPI0013DAC6DB|nr:DUF447 domain-containing protein [Candidatus Laterigemmans baculatus]
MILEAVLTTIDERGRLNVAPMGPHVTPDLGRFTLKPFVGSRTYDNLRAQGRATIHVTDDVLLMAQAVTGTLDPLPATFELLGGDWRVLTAACRYFAVSVNRWEEDPLRPTAHCEIVASGELRPFFGFNRAKHAVIEAAILATRTSLLEADAISAELQRLQPLVEKTAGPDEQQAFELLKRYIAARCS